MEKTQSKEKFLEFALKVRKRKLESCKGDTHTQSSNSTKWYEIETGAARADVKFNITEKIESVERKV